MTIPESIVSRLPIWVLATATITVLGYAGVLGCVAILSERDVTFWPPTIGPGPKSKMVDEFKRFGSDLDKDISELLIQRKQLSENLQIARSSMAKAMSYVSVSESRIWEQNADKIQAEIKDIDKALILKIENAKSEVRRVESKFNGS